MSCQYHPSKYSMDRGVMYKASAILTLPRRWCCESLFNWQSVQGARGIGPDVEAIVRRLRVVQVSSTGPERLSAAWLFIVLADGDGRSNSFSVMQLESFPKFDGDLDFGTRCGYKSAVHHGTFDSFALEDDLVAVLISHVDLYARGCRHGREGTDELYADTPVNEKEALGQ